MENFVRITIEAVVGLVILWACYRKWCPIAKQRVIVALLSSVAVLLRRFRDGATNCLRDVAKRISSDEVYRAKFIRIAAAMLIPLLLVVAVCIKNCQSARRTQSHNNSSAVAKENDTKFTVDTSRNFGNSKLFEVNKKSSADIFGSVMEKEKKCRKKMAESVAETEAKAPKKRLGFIERIKKGFQDVKEGNATIKGLTLRMPIISCRQRLEEIARQKDLRLDVIDGETVTMRLVGKTDGSVYIAASGTWGRIYKIEFFESAIRKLFNAGDMTTREFAEATMNNYGIPKFDAERILTIERYHFKGDSGNVIVIEGSIDILGVKGHAMSLMMSAPLPNEDRPAFD